MFLLKTAAEAKAKYYLQVANKDNGTTKEAEINLNIF